MLEGKREEIIMERERRGKNLVIAALLITVVSLSVAFAATLSSQLNINGTANIGEAKWDVYFDSVTPSATSTATATSAPTISGRNTINYTIDLAENKTYEFTATVKNNGTYGAKLSQLKIAGAEEYSGLITYTVTGMAANDVINAGDSKTLTVKVSMGTITGDNISKLENGASLTLTAVADFVQAD